MSLTLHLLIFLTLLWKRGVQAAAAIQPLPILVRAVAAPAVIPVVEDLADSAEAAAVAEELRGTGRV